MLGMESAWRAQSFVLIQTGADAGRMIPDHPRNGALKRWKGSSHVQNGKSIIRILPRGVGIVTKSIPLSTPYLHTALSSKQSIHKLTHSCNPLKHSSPDPSRINKVLLPTIRLPLLTIVFSVLRRAHLAFTISRSRIELGEDLGRDTVEEFLRVDTQ